MQQIKVVTYNIHRAIGIDRKFAPERIIDILNNFDADIVLLQEVDEGVPRSNELNLAKVLAESCGYPYFALSHNVTLKKGRYGNATLSRLPIIRQNNIDLTVADKKKRGCQHTTIKLNHECGKKNELELFNLHLGLSAREREKQAGILFKSVEFAAIKNKHNCIVGGDFNDWRSMLRALFIIGKDFQCATDRTSFRGAEIALKTYPSFAPRGGLDRIYYRGRLQCTDVGSTKMRIAKVASDHLPVFARFEVDV
ncbi:endonuclease/exonuclease/phosphatase family protein [Marinicella sp. S1101]|uniref:endonuclease/exonuclease/phosphatase family protein n=1 Tax=Marinicella marina TaxID=2996016 RepID=UPI0022608D83|nr:endonuclease/exonuclease/phosphatase family protein [Marinicella marina]MCX7555075.1 endonuclease/exonuclease/phosphatase family protein [Marinicella marina]MDJ1141383.1 endonuclease/exonuclease/phosphatase family protein [Marinicella marina]